MVKVPELYNQFIKQLRFRIVTTGSATPPWDAEFSLIPAGPFQMGDQSSPLVGDSIELPVHTVTVSAFFMAKYETSWLQWKQLRDWARASGLGYTDLADGIGKADDHPVHSVGWYDVVKWCNARTEYDNATKGTTFTPCYTDNGAVYRTGNSDAVVCNWSANGYRLPSEAEWEKSARGGLSEQNFPWGNTIAHSQANYYSRSDYSYDVSSTRDWHPSYNDGVFPYTAPVDSFTANGYGLFNMSGNVWEWCWDPYGAYTSGAQVDTRGATSAGYRVLRGGSWGHYAYGCRVAYRGYSYPDHGNHVIGFRVARSSVP